MPDHWKTILLLLFFLSVSAPAATNGDPASAPEWSVKPLAQYTHRVWMRDQGLPQNSVNAILHARNGYLWIGTQEGIARFDGSRFTILNRRTTPAFRSHYVWSLLEDRSGVIWVGTNGGGLTKLGTPKPSTFGIEQGLPGTTIWSLFEDAGGTLWVGTENGLAFLPSHARDLDMPVFQTVRRLRGIDVRSIAADTDGTLWLGTGRGLFALHDSTVRSIPLRKTAAVHAVRLLQVGGKWSVFFVEGNVLFRVERGVPVVHARLPFRTTVLIFGIDADTSGAVWLATAGAGICRLVHGAWSTFTSRDGLPDNQVRALFIDHEETVWIGTYGGGLNALYDAKFASYSRTSGLANEFVLSVSEGADGSLLIGTYGGGLSILSGSKVSNYSSGRAGIPPIVTSVFGSRSGRVYLCSPDMPPLQFEPGRTHASPVCPGLPRSGNCLFEDRSGRLWVGDSRGVHVVSGSRVRAFGLLNSPIVAPVIAIVEGPDSTIWLGTQGGGLVRYRHGMFTRFTAADGLTNDVITALLPNLDGTLWIGTDGGGLIYFNGERFSSITSAQGLFDDIVFTILEDEQGFLWMSSNNGVFRTHRDDLIRLTNGRTRSITCQSFGTADGMRSSECNGRRQPSAWKDHLGRLWFATLAGVVMIEPSTLRPSQAPPNIAIERLIVDERDMGAADDIEIAAGTQRVAFEYTALSFVSPERTTFRYQLEGYDADWIEAGTRRTAYYTSIPPGQYRFRVTARTSDGIWNEHVAALQFRLRPFFYQTPFFLSAVLFLLVLGAFAFGRWRVRRLQRREVELIDLVAERTQNLIDEKRRVEDAYRDAEQARKEAERLREVAEEANKLKSRLLYLAAHDMKSPLISIKGFAQIMREETDRDSALREMTEMVQNLTLNLLTLINQLLNSEAIESGRMTLVLRRIDATQLARDVVAASMMFAERKQQTIRFDGAEWGTCMIEADEARMRDAFENLVTNAIKFSAPGTTILVRLLRIGPTVRLAVQDEGPGLTAEDKRRAFGKFNRLSAQPTAGESSTGLGLSVTREIVEMHHGTISVESEEGQGSTFFIDLPASA